MKKFAYKAWRAIFTCIMFVIASFLYGMAMWYLVRIFDDTAKFLPYFGLGLLLEVAVVLQNLEKEKKDNI